MATETQTPIEAIESLIFIADPITGDGRKIVADARAALADVEALVVVLSKYPHQHDHRCYVDGRPKGVATLPVCGIPEALALLQVKS